MSRAIIRRARARRDLIDAFTYLGSDDPRVGERFFSAAESTFERIAAMPGIGSPLPVTNPILEGLRRTSIAGFKKYQVLYVSDDQAVEIVRVLHGARDIRAILARET